MILLHFIILIKLKYSTIPIKILTQNTNRLVECRKHEWFCLPTMYIYLQAGKKQFLDSSVHEGKEGIQRKKS